MYLFYSVFEFQFLFDRSISGAVSVLLVIIERSMFIKVMFSILNLK